MYKLKKTLKDKNYWQRLVLEVTEGKSKSPHSQKPSKGVRYATQHQRRHIKYTLGEPFSSIYFTQREAECMIQMLKGKTMVETGKILNLSPRTVEYYLTKIKRKLNRRKKSEIMQLVADSEFVKNFEQDPYNQK